MDSSSSYGATAFSRLVDRTGVLDPTLQRHAVAAFFRHILSLPPPLPAAAHDAVSSLLASPHPAVAAHTASSLARLAAARADLLPPDLALPLLLPPLSASPSSRIVSCLVKAVAALASCVLRSVPASSRFPPHDHPFVQAIASGADGVRAELPRQAARMVSEGVDGGGGVPEAVRDVFRGEEGGRCVCQGFDRRTSRRGRCSGQAEVCGPGAEIARRELAAFRPRGWRGSAVLA